ncbi:MAG: Ig-like domain-containing protein [Desulfitobacteriaceae bacterium]
MKIGRKIYYELATGNIILDAGERQGAVIETPQSEDFAIYPQFIGKDPSAIDFIQLLYGERSAEFINLGSMHVDPVTKALTIYPRLTITTDKLQITANGTDTATVTVTVQDTVNPHAISFTVNNGAPVSVNTVNGVATLPLTTTVTGDYTITATSDLYGTNSVTVKGV